MLSQKSPSSCWKKGIITNHWKRPDIKYTFHDDFAIMTMVKAGLGVGILAKLMLRRTNYDIVRLPTDPPIYRKLAIGFKDKDSLPIASKYFIKYLLENADRLP